MSRPRFLSATALVLSCALALAGCDSAPRYPELPPSARPRADGPAIRGELNYRQRIALPADSVAVVELRELGGNGSVVTDWRRTLLGQQVPVRFDLVYDPARLDPAGSYGLRAAIFSGGQPIWASDAKPVAIGGGNIDAGTLVLAQYQALAFASRLACGGRAALFGVGRRDGRDVPQLVVGDRRYDLREVPSASGARYEAIGDARTTLWSKGDRATVVVGGEAWPECEVQRTGDAAAARALQARGNEPFWSLDIGATLRLRTPAATLEGPAPAPQTRGDTRLYEGRLDDRPISIAARAQRCADTMTGMPYPLTVEMQFDGRIWRGCGGSPAELLVGPEWVAEDIGGGIIDRSRATLAFGADGRLAGHASCNSYTTTWALTGETLTIGKAAATMMACAPGLMQQEGRFLDILQNTRRFEITETGALVLITADNRRITARRGR